MWIRIIIIGGLFLIAIWFVTKPWRDKYNIRIEYQQLFLKFFRLVFRFISPIVLIRWFLKMIKYLRWKKNISKQYVVFRNTKNFHVDKDYSIGFVFTGLLCLLKLETLEKKEKFQKVINERDYRLHH